MNMVIKCYIYEGRKKDFQMVYPVKYCRDFQSFILFHSTGLTHFGP